MANAIERTMFITEQVIIYLLFGIAFAANIVAEYRDSDVGRYYTKPLMMPLILAFYLLMSRETDPLIVTALCFALMGDIFLLITDNNTLFRLGTAAYMGTYLLFSTILVMRFKDAQFSSMQLATALFFALSGLLVVVIFLWKYLLNMKTLGLFYMLTHSALLFLCILQFGHIATPKAIHCLLGAVLLIISDFIVAWRRFRFDFHYSGIYIIITYVIGISMLVTGFMESLVR